MSGRNNLQKQWVRKSFEDELRETFKVSGLIIETPVEENKEQQQEEKTETEKQDKKPKTKKKAKKKKTATDVHLEIKKIIEESPDLDGHEKARSVLEKAFKDGFKGKRLTKWDVYLRDYFKQISESEIVMGSTVKKMWSKQNEKKEILSDSATSSKMPNSTEEEKEEMVDIPDLMDFDEEEVESVEDSSLQDESGGAVVFGIIGSGQAGGRLAQEFYKLGYKKSLAVNTAEHDLNGLTALPEAQKVVMTSEHGGGAGKDMRKGEAAADKHQQEIYEKMQKLFGKVDRILVCAGGGGGCISSDTKVLTDRFGLVAIKDLWSKIREDSNLPKVFYESTEDAQFILKGYYPLKVASSDVNGNISFKNVDAIWNNADKGLAFNIETKDGWVISSAKHPFFVFDFDTNSLVEKKASELSEEDILYSYGQGFEYAASKDKDICWLLGYFAGDGNFKEKTVLRFFDENISNLQKAEKICKKYGVTSTTISKDPRQNSYELYVYGSAICEMVRHQYDIGVGQTKTGNLKLARIANSSSKEDFVAYLAGVLDSDGHVKVGRDSFEIMMIDLDFVNSLCEQARLHGISCSYRLKTSVRENEQVLGRALFQHVKLNGYSDVLLENLEAKKEKFIDSVSIGSIFPVAFSKIEHIVDENCKKDRYFWDYVNGKHLLSHSKAEIFFREYGQGALKTCWKSLVEVQAISTEEGVDYYDLTVEENASYFAGNGQMYLVHNTGSGSCLRLVETAKKYLQYLGVTDVNDRVGVLLTLPTRGESSSPVVASNALLISNTLCKYAEEGQISPLIIFDNDKIDQLYGKRLTVRNYWSVVNQTVTGLFHMFNVLSAQSSEFTSFDPADYNKVLSAGGCMIMGMTNLKEYQNGTDVSKAIRSNLEKGLLCGGFDISTAKAAACIATAPSVVIDNTAGLMESFGKGFDTLANITGNATVFRGIYEVQKDKVGVYTMLTGLKRPEKRLKELEKLQENKVEKTSLF